jgi:hypothetical protein
LPWTCVQLAPFGWFDDYSSCRIACATGQSACHENDTDVGTECRACEASCVPYMVESCDGEAPGSCPYPCGCVAPQG